MSTDMPRTGRILVVDDEVNARTALAELLRDEGFDVETAADAFKALGKYESFTPHVVVTDLKMPGMDGIELVKKIRGGEDPAAVVVMTAFGAVSSAVDAMRAGAADYLTKPLNFDELLVVLDKVFENQELRREARQLRLRVRDRVAPNNIVGVAPPMQRVFEVVDQVAPSKATVLITGESGTGKELVANAIHQRSPRANGPFVKLHCAALAESLLESELFGHEKGSFTGAMARKDGRFQIASGGTLFLDEIGEISPAIQVKLLRFLQEHEFERVGGTQTIRVDVRVIAATNRNLTEEVAKGRFREDLYYRLNVVAIEMPPLRDRRTDIPALAKFFVDRYAKENGKTIEAIAPETLQVLQAYDWPGNVRELENAIERAVVLSKGTSIEARELPSHIRPKATPAGMPLIPGATMAELERFAILETLKATGGSTSKAAEMLGISTRTVQYRLHQYNEAPRSEVDVVRKDATPEKT
ncbi:MAG: sigma-54-dependent Fis family transcriptional regulator [Deltaproteobacteria bacterium]|nr:sigma-54-dependent Fis family transcriptional regulator [Deltaproteobacteria bacterium]MCW5808369.1 sigma-54-dependent Fis family transcriptional regulator [Deltaproteobacteria bacterium]